MESEAERRLSGFEQQALRDKQNQCLASLDGRSALRAAVILSTAASSGFDLTRVPGFDQLDHATQDFFRNLAALSASSSGSSSNYRQKILELIPLPDCDGDGKPDESTVSRRRRPRSRLVLRRDRS